MVYHGVLYHTLCTIYDIRYTYYTYTICYSRYIKWLILGPRKLSPKISHFISLLYYILYNTAAQVSSKSEHSRATCKRMKSKAWISKDKLHGIMHPERFATMLVRVLRFFPDPCDLNYPRHTFPRRSAGFVMICYVILSFWLLDLRPSILNSASWISENRPYWIVVYHGLVQCSLPYSIA